MQSRRCGAILCALGLTATFAVLAPARSADAAPNSITVKTPTTDQVVQREAATGTADVSVSGTLDVTGPVEASLDGTNWTPLGVTGTTFSGVLEDQPVGRATLQVRSTTAPAVSTSVPGVGVGDVFAVMGDSNTSGESPTLHTYTGPPGQVSLFTNARRWRTLTADPVDGIDEDAPLGNCRWFFFTCLHHALYDAHVAGTIWPGVASRLTTAAPGVPIGLVVMGKSASGLFCDPARVSSTCWQKPTGGWAADTTLSLYADALARLRAMAPAGGIRAVLWFEGINDTGSAGTATGRSDYLAMVNRFVANLVTDYGPLDFVLSSPGDCDPALKPTCAGRDTALDNVRGGVEDGRRHHTWSRDRCSTTSTRARGRRPTASTTVNRAPSTPPPTVSRPRSPPPTTAPSLRTARGWCPPQAAIPRCTSCSTPPRSHRRRPSAASVSNATARLSRPRAPWRPPATRSTSH